MGSDLPEGEREALELLERGTLTVERPPGRRL